jgi:hypothetical protein
MERQWSRKKIVELETEMGTGSRVRRDLSLRER